MLLLCIQFLDFSLICPSNQIKPKLQKHSELHLSIDQNSYFSGPNTTLQEIIPKHLRQNPFWTAILFDTWGNELGLSANSLISIYSADEARGCNLQAPQTDLRP